MLDIGQVNVFKNRTPNLGFVLEIQKSEDETVTDNSNSLLIDSTPNLSNDEQDKSVKSYEPKKKLLGKRPMKKNEKSHSCSECNRSFNYPYLLKRHRGSSKGRDECPSQRYKKTMKNLN
jgi:hypothetical protein